MSEERNHHHPHSHFMDQCKNYAFHHVILTMRDGTTIDAIIENVRDDGIDVLLGEEVEYRGDTSGFGYGAFGGFGGYGYGFPRYRRFGRAFLPLAGLAGIALLPYLFPPVYPGYGFGYPPYPYF